MDIPTVIVAAVFGGVAAVLANSLKAWTSRSMHRRVEIRLRSGDRVQISAEGMSPADLNKLVGDIQASIASGDQQALSAIENHERILAEASSLLQSGGGSSSSLASVRKALENLLQRNPLDKRAAIILARYENEIAGGGGKDLNALKRAITVLSRFVNAKREAGQTDKDYADGLYNIACYKALMIALLSEQRADPDTLMNTKKSLIVDLKESLRVSPENKYDVASDPDFRYVLNDSSFKEAIFGGVTPNS